MMSPCLVYAVCRRYVETFVMRKVIGNIETQATRKLVCTDMARGGVPTQVAAATCAAGQPATPAAVQKPQPPALPLV